MRGRWQQLVKRTVRGDDHNRCAVQARGRQQVIDHGAAIHIGQQNIQDNQLRGVLIQQIEGFLAIGGFQDSEAQAMQQGAVHNPQRSFIFDNQGEISHVRILYGI